MDIQDTIVGAKVVIESLVALLENENVDMSSIKSKVGNQEEGYESKAVSFESLINLTLNELEAAKSQAVPEGFVLVKASDYDREILELIDQRDHMESQAEELKDKLQELYGVDFGEHSSCNFPFQNAIDFDDSDLVLVPKDPDADTLTKMSEAVHLGDDASGVAVYLSIDECKMAYKAMIETQEKKG